MVLVGPPMPGRPQERSQTEREKLVLQEWGFCGWAGNPCKEKIELLISKRPTALDIGGPNGR